MSVAVKNEGTEYQLTKSGDRKFSFGSANENELVFVPGKSGRIEFVFSELYSAKRVKPAGQLSRSILPHPRNLSAAAKLMYMEE